MTTECRIQWTWRPGGGLFVGLRVHRPCRVLFDDGTVRDVVTVAVGLGPVTVFVDFRSRAL